MCRDESPQLQILPFMSFSTCTTALQPWIRKFETNVFPIKPYTVRSMHLFYAFVVVPLRGIDGTTIEYLSMYLLERYSLTISYKHDIQQVRHDTSTERYLYSVIQIVSHADATRAPTSPSHNTDQTITITSS